MSNSLHHVKNWLLNSGIFISDPDDKNYGAVYSYYDEEKKSFSFLYPEITGYYASTMRFLYSHDCDDEFLNRARASCDWLAKLFETHKGIIQGVYDNITPSRLIYSFDTAICAKAMFDCYKISKDSKYLNLGKKLNRWIIDNTINDDGTIKPFYNMESEKFESSKNEWYKQYGCLHIKLIMSLLTEYQFTKDKSLLKNSTNIANNITRFQNNDGSIRLHENNDIINLHTLCYALEGLLYAYFVTRDQNLINLVIRTLTWCDKQILSDGSLDLWYNSKYHSKSSYPIAQLIRLKILIMKMDESIKYNFSNQKKFLLDLQSMSSNSNSFGGFYEEFSKSIFGWKKNSRINSWSSMFALQALFWVDNFQKIKVDNEIQLLF